MSDPPPGPSLAEHRFRSTHQSADGLNLILPRHSHRNNMSPSLDTFTTPSGTQTHYLQSGNANGPLIICMHGLGGSSKTFLPLLPHIPQSYNTVIVDFPGYGKTPRNTTQTVTIPGLVADLQALVQHIQSSHGTEDDKVIIFGHSLGSIVGLHFAAQFPAKVGGMFLLGAGRSASHIPAVRQRMLDTATKTRTEGIEAVAKGASIGNFPSDEQRVVPPANRQAVYDEVAAADPEAYAQTCEAIVGEEHKDPDYAQIKCPVTFIAGDLDVISPVERSEGLSKLLGGSARVEVVKGGHQPIIDDIEPVVAAMTKLLEQIAAPM
ncbi:Alpha/Beta hydrolase protein [Microdochium trichocladiopsis]|uniref:Alpha/Beta hydrolase protein n=1 Tax=Microdochium trichocladiopsis TaxID=1682393 RepID=A0A9P8XWG3_9PEZI|nr:Alpha/Beta hydrolase protein [Microdochium trichocladiopsis]KAH7021202.1 Alpha/Beta hydrolase protein [Microdochium trichocladiopsis]